MSICPGWPKGNCRSFPANSARASRIPASRPMPRPPTVSRSRTAIPLRRRRHSPPRIAPAGSSRAFPRTPGSRPSTVALAERVGARAGHQTGLRQPRSRAGLRGRWALCSPLSRPKASAGPRRSVSQLPRFGRLLRVSRRSCRVNPLSRVDRLTRVSHQLCRVSLLLVSPLSRLGRRPLASHRLCRVNLLWWVGRPLLASRRLCRLSLLVVSPLWQPGRPLLARHRACRVSLRTVSLLLVVSPL